MSKKDCKIIEDLLPNYIEGLTNEQTNKFIKNHLSECKICNDIYKDMIKDIQVDKIDMKEIDYLKRVKRNFKIATWLIIICVLIIVIFFNTMILREQRILIFPDEKNSMLIISYQDEFDNNIIENIKNYYIFDKNDKCITTFVEISSNNQEYLENKYLELKSNLEKEEIDGNKAIISAIRKRTNKLSYLGLKYENDKITYSTVLNNNVEKERIKAFTSPKMIIEEY